MKYILSHRKVQPSRREIFKKPIFKTNHNKFFFSTFSIYFLNLFLQTYLDNYIKNKFKIDINNSTVLLKYYNIYLKSLDSGWYSNLISVC